MATTSPAVVTQVTGRAYIRNADGSLTELHVGSHVAPNSEIVTASGSTVALQVEGGMPLMIGENRDVAFNGDVAGAPVDAQEAALAAPTGTDSDRLLAALQNGQDPFDNLDPTAALVAGGGDAGGSSFVRLARIVEATSPLGLEYPNDGPAATLNNFNSAGVAINNNANNDSPNAGNDTNTTAENAPVFGNILTNDTDPNGDALAIVAVGDRPMATGGVSVAGSTGGTFTVFPDGSYVFNPGDGYHQLGAGQTATSTAQYTVTDPSGATSTATITVTINGVNDAPTSTTIAALHGADADKGVNVDVSSHFTDVDNGDKLTFSATGLPPGLVIDPTTGVITGTIDHSASQGGDHGAYQVVVTATDTGGATNSQTFTWDVTNPGPVAANDAGATEQEGHTSGNVITGDALGNGQDTDPDGDTLAVSQVNGQADGVGHEVAGSNGGTFTLNADGTYTFNTNDSFDHLGAGKTDTSSITYTVSDGQGGTSTATLTVTVTGTNDAAVITPHEGGGDGGNGGDGGIGGGEVREDVKFDTSGKLDITDKDDGEAVFVGQDGTKGDHGTFAIGADGTWTYHLNNEDTAVQALGEGEHLTETFTVASADGTTSTVTVTIDGTNDAPVIHAETGADVATVGEDATAPVTGQLTQTDVDTNDSHTWSVADNGQGAYGTLTVDDTGKWTYTVNNAAAQTLAADESKTEKFTVTVDDGHGGTDTHDVVITVTGSNDAPVITPHEPVDPSNPLAGDQGTVVEDTTLSVGGKFDITDADHDQSSFQAQTDTAGKHGTFSIGADGTWTYNLNNGDTAVQGLAVGEHLTETFLVVTADGTQTQVVVTIDGTNDIPEISGEHTGAVKEDVDTSVSGQLAVSDVDSSDTHTWAIDGSPKGAYGTLTVDDHGKWTYTVDNAATQKLAEGQKVDDQFTVQVDDGHGGTDTQVVTVTVTGTNDTPVVTGSGSGFVIEDGWIFESTSGKLEITDADAGQAHFQADQITTAYGTFTVKSSGSWTFNLDNDNPEVQALALGQKLIETYEVKTADGTLTSVTVTIFGTNDAPHISGAHTGTITEDHAASVSGQLNVSDVDTLDTHSWSIAGGNKGAYGSLAVDQTGKWTYTVDNQKIQALREGETVQEKFAVWVSDGHGGLDEQTVTVTLTGTNDVPVITPHNPIDPAHPQAGDQGTVVEDTTLSVNGKMDISDADKNESSFKAQAHTNGDHGTFSLNSNGSWTYTLHNTDAAVQQLAVGEHLTETFKVFTADGTETKVVVTIEGTNDAPVIHAETGADKGTIGEDATAPVTGQLTQTDVDKSDSHTWSVADNGHGAYGTLTVDDTGKWTYTVNNAAAQTLAADESKTEKFTVTVDDGHGGTDTHDVVITVTGSNDAPVIVGHAQDQSGVDAKEITNVDMSQFFHDVDDGDTLTYSVAGLPKGLTIDAHTGVISGTIDHSASVAGPYTVVVTADDGHGGHVNQTFTWNVSNPAPEATSDTGSTNEGATLSVTNPGQGVLANDKDIDGDTLSVTHVTGKDGAEGDAGAAVAGTNGGSFTINADGTYTFVPDNGFDHLGQGQTATTSVTYTMTDGEGGQSTATLTVTVVGTNDAPVLVGHVDNQDGVDAKEITNVDMSQFFHDVDDGDTLSYTVTGLPKGLTIDAHTGVISGTIDHSASVAGPYTVVVTADDGHGGHVNQTFTWNVSNPAPEATSDTGSTNEGATLSVTNPGQGVLANDKDIDGDTLSVTHVAGKDGAEGDAGAAVAGTNGGSFTINADGTYTFVPDNSFDHLGQGQTATTSVTYTMTDGEGGQSTATLTVTVVGTNDAPVLVGHVDNQDGVDAKEITNVDMSQYFHDVDDGDTLSYTVTGLPKGLTIDAHTGVISGTIDHSASVAGPYTVVVTADDGHGGHVNQTFTWNVSNPAPEATSDTGSTNEGATLSVTNPGQGVLANDKDIDGDTLSVTHVAGKDGAEGDAGAAVAGTNGGSFTINADGTYTFVPDSSFDHLGQGQTATTQVTYTMTDGEGGQSTATLTVTVVGTNDAPVLVGHVDNQDGVDAKEITNVDMSQFFHDVDDGDTLTYSVAGLPKGLTIDAHTGVISGTIDHSASVAGPYTVVVTADDGHGGHVNQTFTWNVSNPAPEATSDTGSTNEGATLSVTNPGQGVLANDKDIDGDTLSVTHVAGKDGAEGDAGAAVAGTNGGSFTINADGTYTFVPDSSFDHLGQGQTATTQVTYTMTDGEGGQSTATLTVTVVGTNDAPVLVGHVDNQDGVDAKEITNVDMSQYFHDVDDGDTLSYTVTGLPKGLTIDAHTGVISGTIDHSASVAGPYTVVVTADDGHGGHVNQTFTWNVSNPAPEATSDTGSTNEGATLSVTNPGQGVLANDKDIDGDTLSVTHVAGKDGAEGDAGAAVAGTNGGSFTINADGTYTFVPDSSFDHLGQGQTATTSVTYTMTDGEGGQSTATLTVTVVGTNDAPVLVGHVDNQDGVDAKEITNVDMSQYFHDVDDGDTLSYTVTGLPKGLTIDAHTGVISGTIDHSASVAGPYTVVVTADDGHGGHVNQTFTWNVSNPAPEATSDTGSTNEGATLSVTNPGQGVLANDKDIDGDTLSVTHVTGKDGAEGDAGAAVAGTNGGSFTINADGTYTFVPDNGFDHLGQGQTATTSVTYTMTDGEGGQSTATLTVTVVGTNDAPVLVGHVDNQDGVDAKEITNVDMSQFFHDVDDGDTLSYTVTGLPKGLTIDAHTGVISGTIDHSASVAGPYTVVVTADDGHGGHVNQTFTWNVSNPAPEATSDTGSTNEGATLSVTNPGQGVLANDKDIDGDTLSVTHVAGKDGAEGDAGAAVAGTNGGSFTINADGTYTFVPDNSFDHLGQGQTATTQVTYTMTDGEGGQSTATLTVTVVGTNDAPVLVGHVDNQDGVDAKEITNVDMSQFFHDVDDGDTLTYSVAGLPKGLTIDAHTGVISGTIDHSASVAGPYTVVVTADDGHGGHVNQTFTWNVSNPAPEAVADTGTAAPGSSISGNVITGDAQGHGKDTDPDGDTLSVTHVTGKPGSEGDAGTQVTGTNGGTFTVNADGSYTFNAGHDFDNLKSGNTAKTHITYQVSDGQGGYATATLEIEVTGTNHAPTSTALSNLHNDDSNTVNINLSGHFHDADNGDTLTYAASGLPDGLKIDTSTGVITGTLGHSDSQHGNNGVYAITITATDSHGAATTQTFDWTISNLIPTAKPDAGATNEGVTLSVTDPHLGVLANDKDPDGDTLSVTHVLGKPGSEGDAGQSVTGTNGGTFTVHADGTYTFVPGDSFEHLGQGQTDTTSVTYTVSDGEGGQTTAQLIVTITGTNDVPSITGQGGNGVGDVGTVYEDYQGSIAHGKLDITDTDTGENHVQPQVSVKDEYGTFTIDQDGNWTYTLDNSNPAVQALSGGQSLPDRTFTVTSQDGTATHTVTVHVNGTNDAPTSADNSAHIGVGGTHTFTTGDFAFADSHGESDHLQSIIISKLPDDGSLTLNGTAVHAGQTIAAADIGKLVYTPPADGHDTSFGFKVVDTGGTANGGQNTSGEYNFTLATDNLVRGGNEDSPGTKPLNGGSGNDVIVADAGGLDTVIVPGKSYNVALIVDHSGSMGSDLQGGDVSGNEKSRMDVVKAALLNLLTSLDTHDGGTVNVALIGFGESADKTIQVQGLTTGNVNTLINAINHLSADGGTNYEAAFNSAVSWFNAQAAAGKTGGNYENVSYFLTDGDPTYYLKSNGDVGGNGSSTDDTTLQNSIDSFHALSGISGVNAIGIGDGVSGQFLQYFDNTSANGNVTVGIGSHDDTTLAKSFTNNGSGLSGISSWDLDAGGSGSGLARVSGGDYMRITDAQGSGATTATSTNFNVTGSKTSLSFDVSTTNFNSGDSFTWAIEKQVNGSWVTVQSGTTSSAISDFVTIESNILAAGTYHLVYSVTDNTSGNSAAVNIDNIVTHAYDDTITAPAGSVDIVHQASDLDAVLQGGGSHTTPSHVGNDTINGGDGSDIIFGDSINTDALAWAGHAAGTHNGQGMQGLTDFLAANGNAATSGEIYDYIKGHTDDFNLIGDQRGGNDTIHGGAGNDIIYGQGGNDLIVGGQGNDTLYGGTGSDTFKWELHDQGTIAAPAVDTIKDFSNETVANGGDVLNLNELLHNPENADLSKYLNFTSDGHNTVINVSTTGHAANNQFDQKIIIENVDLTNGHTTDQAAIINDLLQKGKLTGHS